MNYYLDALKKYAVFDGRATRSEYWYFILFHILISVGINIVAVSLNEALSFLGTIYALGVFLPSLGVGFRRLHDTGHSAWWMLIGIIPIVGTIILIVFLAGDSEEGSNKYGSNPKVAEEPKMSNV